jgi:hypothetical protein
MFRRVMSIAVGIALSSATCAAAETAVPSFRSQTCNSICDLFTALKLGLPSARTADAPGAEAPLPKPRPRGLAHYPVRIYAARSVADFYDLQGRSVSLGLQGSDSETAGRRMLAGAGVEVQEEPLDVDDAFDALGLGNIDALAVASPKAYAMMESIPAKYGVHRIEIPAHRAAEAHDGLKRTASLSSKAE